jgi:CHAT domain-containing protein
MAFKSLLHGASLVFAGWLVVASHSAHAQTTSPADIASLLKNKDKTALKAKFKEEPPANSFLPMVVHYRTISLLANALGDTEAQLDISRRWIKADPKDLSALWNLTSSLQQAGLYEEAIQKGELLLQKVTYPHEKVRVSSDLASNLISVGRYVDAAKLLKEYKAIEDIGQYQGMLTGGGQHSFWPIQGSAKYYKAQCELASTTYRFKEAEALCTKEVGFRGSAKAAAPMLPDVNHRLNSVPGSIYDEVMAKIRLAMVLAQAGKYYSAEQLMRQLKAQMSDKSFMAQITSTLKNDDQRLMQVGNIHLVPVYNAHANIRFMQHRYKEAETFSKEAVREALAGEYGNYGEKTRLALETKLRIALVLGDWQGMTSDLATIDQLTQGASADQKSSAKFPLIRALLAQEKKDWSRADALLADYHKELLSILGERHFKTALVAGLRARAGLQAGTNPALYQSMLRTSVQVLFSPDTSGQNISDQGENRTLLRQVMQAFLQDARTDSASDAALAFQTADFLRANATQRSVQAAAIRRSLTDTGLASLVRELQDLESQLQTYTERLGLFLSKDFPPDAPELVALRTNIERTEIARLDVRNKIDAKYADYAKLTEPKPASVQTIAKQLKAGDLFIAVSPSEDSTLLWAIAANGSVVMHKAALNQAQVQEMVTQLRATLDVAGMGDKAPAFDHPTAQKLYQQLLAPLLSVIPAADKPSHLVIAVSGAMTQLPMGVLPTSTGSAQPRWLIQDYAITHVTSASSWLAVKESGASNRVASEPLLAWGDPSFSLTTAAAQTSATRRVRATMPTQSEVDTHKVRALQYDQIPALPETRDELVAIASSLKASEKDLILGALATKNSVLDHNNNGTLARKRVIAFATHGLLAGDVPDLTQPALALALQSSNTSDLISNLLTLDDILGLKLQADWVVLSACNTAGADGANHDGISGLVRGFFYAGARSVLATHWAVESQSAMTLTTETFKNYQSKPQEAKAESLRQAMLTVMNDPATSHPTYWAPYALVGDGAR